MNLSSFAIDKHPVTNEQFVRFLEAMGGKKIIITTISFGCVILASSGLVVNSQSSLGMQGTLL
ncbi:MAG: SUMF1/EgtB/PvdO family nonheme iron enzyme [Rhabdochlamydiaceae bacterium]